MRRSPAGALGARVGTRGGGRQRTSPRPGPLSTLPPRTYLLRPAPYYPPLPRPGRRATPPPRTSLLRPDPRPVLPSSTPPRTSLQHPHVILPSSAPPPPRTTLPYPWTSLQHPHSEPPSLRIPRPVPQPSGYYPRNPRLGPSNSRLVSSSSTPVLLFIPTNPVFTPSQNSSPPPPFDVPYLRHFRLVLISSYPGWIFFVHLTWTPPPRMSSPPRILVRLPTAPCLPPSRTIFLPLPNIRPSLVPTPTLIPETSLPFFSLSGQSWTLTGLDWEESGCSES